MKLEDIAEGETITKKDIKILKIIPLERYSETLVVYGRENHRLMLIELKDDEFKVYSKYKAT